MSNGWLTGFPAGLITTLICFAGAAAIIVCNRWMKKVTNCYFFWLGLSIAILAYFISCRFAISWNNLAQAIKEGGWPDGSTYSGAQLISRAFLMDFCPFFGMLTPILLIVDPSRKAARSVAPILLLGTIFTCTAGFLTYSEMSMEPYWWWHGPAGWELYVGLHMFNMWLAVLVLCNTPKFEFEGYLIMLGCVALYIVYIIIVKYATGCELATSGLSVRDWVMNYEGGVEHPGTYYPITKIFASIFGYDKDSDIAPKVAMGITWPLELLLFSGIVALWDKAFKHFKWHQFGNARNKKMVVLPTGQKVKQWWYWYDCNKFVEPYRIPWKPLNTVSKFWSSPKKYTKK